MSYTTRVHLSEYDTSVDELVVIRTVAGEPKTLWAGDCVDVLVKYCLSGEYLPAKINAPMEHCYPEEWPDLEIDSITLTNPCPLFDGEDETKLVMVLPAGTDILKDLSKSQFDLVDQNVWDAAMAATEDY